MLRLLLPLTLSLLAGCGSTWEPTDPDGDGFTIPQGDCNEAEGGEAIFPGAAEIWYDGIDQNCDGLSDFDKDGDGFDAIEFEGPDCWDDDENFAEFEALNGLPVLTAADVHPGTAEAYYDGIDQDCDGASDFDQDLDGYDTSNTEYRQRDGSVGDDCFDVTTDPYPESGEVTVDMEPGDVNPGAGDSWYDGTDQDCDLADDYDQDGDGFPIYAECDDTNPAIVPRDDVEEIWYNDADENCDGNLYDKDLDGHDSALYGGDDCWDDYDSVPTGYDAINGRTQPTADQVYPTAVDAPYDGVDGDCAGDSDFDADDDGYDADDVPDRAGQTGDDCDDGEDTTWPGASDAWYDGVDSNCDAESDYDADGDGYDSEDQLSGGTDCDDSRAAVNPAPATNENCVTSYDDNCDGALDLQDASGCTEYFRDLDGDGYGDEDLASQCWCDEQTGSHYEVINNDDCNDLTGAISPSADEICDAANTDEDCDGTADNGDATALSSGKTRYYRDVDQDNYGDETHAGTLYCDDPSTASSYYTTDNTDCDDGAATDHPGATEIVGNLDDENCDGSETCYDDDDDDGYIDTSADTRVSADLDCSDAYEATNTAATTDCDDSSATDYPGATEIVGNEDDESCDGGEICYHDDDNDGYLDTTADTYTSTDTDCTDAYEGTASDLTTDCDDASATDYPGATEIIGNGDDESCDGSETCYDDDDNDGYLDTSGDTRVSSDTDCGDIYEGSNGDPTSDCDDTSAADHPGATETVGNGDDEDCDGTEICYDDDDNDGYLDATADTRASTDTDCADSYEGTDTDLTTDCSEADAAINPAATELAGDEVDQNCDGAETCYEDDDDDGFLDTTGDTRASTDVDCDDAYEASSSALTTDCDDTSASDYPGATETVGNGDDENCDGSETCYDDDDDDGYLDTTADTRTSSDTDCSDTNEGTNTDLTTDCDDASAEDHPGATEIVGNGDDEDCNGSETCYDDDDDDGFLDTTADTRTSSDTDCADTNEGTNTDLTTDCDDASASDYPDAPETVGNGDDEDCDGAELCYDDDDDDGYLDTTADTRTSSDTDCSDTNEGTNTDLTTDCDDESAEDHPGATEIVGNGDDEDCVDGELCYDDDDDDGFLDTSGDTRVSANAACTDANEGTNTDPTTDCNDANASVSPSDSEVCNSVDDDCNGSVDDGLIVYYPDADGDSDGQSGVTGDCALTSGVTNDDDCDDTDANVFLGAPELCDGMYNDCADGSAWTSTDEAGTASFVTASGDWSDVTSSFDLAGASTINLSSGTYYLCDGDWYGQMLATTGDDVYIIGRNGDASTTFHASADSALEVLSGATQVTVQGLTLTDGSGTGTGQIYGGAVYVTDTNAADTDVTIQECTLTANSAGFGGGLAVDGYAMVSVVDSVIEGNLADDGGGIWVATDAYVLVDGTIVTDNDATDDGGGICLDGNAEADLIDSLLYLNGATHQGGGLYVESGVVTADTVEFYTNTALDGGGIWLDTGSVTLLESAVYGNTATGNGGGVALYGAGTLDVTASDFDGTAANAPFDIEVRSGPWDPYTYDAAATFSCSAGSCSADTL